MAWRTCSQRSCAAQPQLPRGDAPMNARILMVLASLLSLSLVACGDKEGDDTAAEMAN